MTDCAISIRPLGDRAFSLYWEGTVEIGNPASKARAIDLMNFPWLMETVAAYRSITFYMRGSDYSLRSAAERLIGVLDTLAEQTLPTPRQVVIPVVYGGEYGPDLSECARRSGVSEAQFAKLHSEASYTVAMMGFAPGFPYLSGLPGTLAQPRHDTPRLKVSAGAVGIAGNQTGVYPVTSPGGWQIIGRTDVPLYRPNAEEPFLLAQGDRVKFVSVDKFSEVKSDSKMRTVQGKGESRSLTPSTPLTALKVLKSGLLTTIQDLGRQGWQRYGVSVGGAMDRLSMRRANLLVGNEEGAAVLELTMVGGSYSIERDILVSICGGNLVPTANGASIPMNKPVFLSRGTTLSFGTAVAGCRAYLAIAGGIYAPRLLGSRSMDVRAGMGGGFGRSLTAGDSIGVDPYSSRTAKLVSKLRNKAREGVSGWSTVDWQAKVGEGGDFPRATYDRIPTGRILLRVLPGAEWDSFTVESRNRLVSGQYRIETNSDRMGIRLSGGALTRTNYEELESHGVVAGTIQVPPDGQPIILGSGCQPTGGYPKIAHVLSADMPRLAQAVPGDRMIFELSDIDQAEQAIRQQERELAILTAGIKTYGQRILEG
ncbi:5-oxoprolinase subunit PxpB [Cohnella herbarum]|uniref:5-oxoprolinase subunit PxpB n=1 Tax=Cohnella herbarum TaxID=2728023 RepID=A0A7Z2VQE1_9BACL|nr:5-oxoprolinase subunit PxpB [Cohnella herbarum]QJD87543.1 5-oxoprolinase subunit PxpB [Cohnella herbarum]